MSLRSPSRTKAGIHPHAPRRRGGQSLSRRESFEIGKAYVLRAPAKATIIATA
jgi:transketolase C-terminal domain/subunit